jgi:hypothetical protein
MPVEAKVLLDSVSPRGDRLTTIEGEMHRYVLAENNTHRGLNKNSASSRAIPVAKTLARVRDDPAFPLVWASEKPGMQGGSPLEGVDLEEAMALVSRIHSFTVGEIARYLERHPLLEGTEDTRLHKSVLNRYLEPFMWHRVIMSGTDAMWDNFFRLRSTHFTDKAQPEMAAFADAIYEAMQASAPTPMSYGEWHTPLIRGDDDFGIFGNPTEARKFVSAGRCARVSYLTHDGVRDMSKDLDLVSNLCVTEPGDPIHASPFEHVATPAWPDDAPLGNLKGWHQLRHHVEQQLGSGRWASGRLYIKHCIGDATWT